MPNIDSKQKRRENLVSKMYSIYDAMSFVSDLLDVAIDSRLVIIEALENELAMTKEILKQVEKSADEESEDVGIFRQINRVHYLS